MAVIVTEDAARVVRFSSEAFTSRPCLDKSVSMGTTNLRDATILASAPSEPILAVARLCVAAMLVGIAEAVTAMIVDYAKIRNTFGRPIGSYQAVRHPCAEMAVRAEIARALLFYAAVAHKEGRRDAPLQADTAKYLANEAALMNVDANIQLHGGIGTTDEHDAHLFMKRSHVLNRWFGANRALGSRILRAPVSD
jgi:alkylation response protein AidB-like acyl-CoA dehydrogenase